MPALSLCTCCRHYPGTATGGTALLIRPVISTFPGMAAGSACASTFSRLAQRSLTLRPAHSRCHQFVARLSEGFRHFVTSMPAPVASGWSGCRVGLAPTGKRRLFTAHATSSRTGSRKIASPPTGLRGTADVDRRPFAGVEIPKAAARSLSMPKTRRPSATHDVEWALPTQRRRWHFSGRAAAPLRKLPFANQAEKSMPRDCGRPRLVRPGQHGRADERLLLQAANWRCRPMGAAAPIQDRSFLWRRATPSATVSVKLGRFLT